MNAFYACAWIRTWSITVQHLFENECFSSWESCYTVWAHIRTQLTEQKAARSHLGQNIYMLPNFPFRHLLSKSRDSKPITSELVIFMDTHVAQSWSAFQKSAGLQELVRPFGHFKKERLPGLRAKTLERPVEITRMDIQEKAPVTDVLNPISLFIPPQPQQHFCTVTRH